MSDRYERPLAQYVVSNGGLILGHIWSLLSALWEETIKKSQKANRRKVLFQSGQTLKDKGCQGSPCVLHLGGLSCSLRVTSVPLGSTVPTHPMAPVGCTGYECQTCSHVVGETISLPLLSFKQHTDRPLRLPSNVTVAINTIYNSLLKHSNSLVLRAQHLLGGGEMCAASI